MKQESKERLLAAAARQHVTLQLQKRTCGKMECATCLTGGHGPYWYAYWNEFGKTRSCYIGKELPQDLYEKIVLHWLH